MKKLVEVKSITVLGRLWFDKANGNTYCSALILVNGREYKSFGPTYGYGNYYVQKAGEILEEIGITDPEKYSNGGMEPLWRYCTRNNIEFFTDHTASKMKEMYKDDNF